MSLQPYTGYLRTAAGAPAVDAVVTVKTLAGLDAALFADAAGQTSISTLLADANGRFEFFVAGGAYEITASLNGDELPPFKIALPVINSAPSPGLQLHDLGIESSGTVTLDFNEGASFSVELDAPAELAVANIPNEARMTGTIEVTFNDNDLSLGPDFKGTLVQAGFNTIYIAGLPQYLIGPPYEFPGAAQGFVFKNGGLHLYVSDYNLTLVVRWTLNQPFILDGLGITPEHSLFDVSNEVTTIGAVRVSDDETKILVADLDDGTIYQYNLSVAGDLSTASYSGNSFNPSATVGNFISFDLMSNETTLIVAGHDGGGSPLTRIYEWTLSGTYDISSPSYIGVGNAAQGGEMHSFRLASRDNTDDIVVYSSIADDPATEDQNVILFKLDTPGDIGSMSMSPDDSFRLGLGEFRSALGPTPFLLLDPYIDFNSGNIYTPFPGFGGFINYKYSPNEMTYRYTQLDDATFLIESISVLDDQLQGLF